MTEPPIDIVDRFPQPTTVVVEVEHDWCDECDINIPAKLYAQLPSGRTVTYCGHHGTIHFEALLESGARIIDHRHHGQ